MKQSLRIGAGIEMVSDKNDRGKTERRQEPTKPTQDPRRDGGAKVDYGADRKIRESTDWDKPPPPPKKDNQ